MRNKGLSRKSNSRTPSHSQGGPTIDLHGATVEDALRRLDQFLHHLSNSNAKRARVMTGKGTGTIQRAVIDYLRQARYQWKYETLGSGKSNEGVLVLFLD